jgi:hypothetical protein
MSTQIAPQIEKFAEEFANELYPRSEWPASNEEMRNMAAVAIQKWENSKQAEPSKSVFTELFEAQGYHLPLPFGKRMLWRHGDGSFTVGEAEEVLGGATSYIAAYAELPYDSGVL